MDEIKMAVEQQDEAERILDVVKGLRTWSCNSWRSCWRRNPMASCWRPRSFWCGTARIGSGCDCGRPLWKSGKRGACGSRVNCSECHESAKFVEYRDRDVRTLPRSGRHDRAYYHCGHCGHGCSGPTSLRVFTALRRCLASVFGAFNNQRAGRNAENSGENHVSSEFSQGWPSGLEPPTSGSTIRRSNQLSYDHHRQTQLAEIGCIERGRKVSGHADARKHSPQGTGAGGLTTSQL